VALLPEVLMRALIALALLPVPALAQGQSEILFSHKNWKVEVVQFDDGSLSCAASVGDIANNFTIWADPDQSMSLQFYSGAWEFGEGTTADLVLEVDSRGPWSLTAAELYKQSVLFDLPDSDQGVAFLVEVAAGRRIDLRDKDGADVQWYSLAGSRAAMDALIACGDAIRSPEKNPFK
jgi:hypothetical protein